jgi:hypothetical protein
VPEPFRQLQAKELPLLRARIGSTITVVAATIGLASSVAGPIYAAFGGQSASAGAVSTPAGKMPK